jgi:hypothetical protein
MALTLEAATIIRVPPPGRAGPYALAVVRTDDGLVCGGLLLPDALVPSPGAVVAEIEPVDGVRRFSVPGPA